MSVIKNENIAYNQISVPMYNLKYLVIDEHRYNCCNYVLRKSKVIGENMARYIEDSENLATKCNERMHDFTRYSCHVNGFQLGNDISALRYKSWQSI